MQVLALFSTYSTTSVNSSAGSIVDLSDGQLVSSKLTTVDTEYGTVLVEDNIVKRSNDDREFRHLTLPNGLKCFLISDEGTTKAAAALDINIGSSSNPPELKGLAHFLEHLLFMGTEKYPDEAEYSKFIANHGGVKNASTSPEHTKFYFNVSAGYLEESLDRFSQFFISPLFNESCVEREMKAVDSEHMGHLTNETFRILEVMKYLSSPEHPNHHFYTGNIESLGVVPKENGIDIRSAIIDFYKTHYSANLMRLAVYGKESLDELQSMVISRFSQIPNHNFQLEPLSNRPLNEKHFGTLIRVKTLKEMYSLTITWQIDDINAYYEYKPWNLLEIISCEYESSVTSVLKARGWISSVTWGFDNELRGCSFIQVAVGLTKDGYTHYSEVVKIIFQFINLLKSSNHLERLAKEKMILSEINYENGEKADPLTAVTRLSTQMHDYPPYLTMKGAFVPQLYDEKIIAYFLEQLSVDNFRIVIACKEDIADPQIEKWFKTEYSVEPLSQEFLSELSSLSASNELALPKPNRFIPSNMDLKPLPLIDPGKYPYVITDNPSVKVWFKQDDLFRKPSGAFALVLDSSTIDSSDVRNAALCMTFVHFAAQSLRSIRSEAASANLFANIKQTGVSRIIISFDGYADKLENFSEEIMVKIMTFVPSDMMIKLFKDGAKKNFNNINHLPILQLANLALMDLTIKNYYPLEELLRMLQELSIDEIVDFRTEFFKSFTSEALCYGNFLPEEATSIMERIQNAIISHTESGINIKKEALILPPSGNASSYEFVYVHPLTIHPSNGISFSLSTCPLTDARLRTVNLLFTQIFQSLFYDQLRTKESLGYHVSQSTRESNLSSGVLFYIQGPSDPIHLHERIDEFISTCPSILKSMSDEDFEKHKDSTISHYVFTLKNTADEFDKLWAPITAKHYDFDVREKIAAGIKGITKKDMKHFIRDYIVKGSPKRKLLAVHLRSQKSQQVDATAYDNKGWDFAFEIIEARNKLSSLMTFED